MGNFVTEAALKRMTTPNSHMTCYAIHYAMRYIAAAVARICFHYYYYFSYLLLILRFSNPSSHPHQVEILQFEISLLLLFCWSLHILFRVVISHGWIAYVSQKLRSQPYGISFMLYIFIFSSSQLQDSLQLRVCVLSFCSGVMSTREMKRKTKKMEQEKICIVLEKRWWQKTKMTILWTTDRGSQDVERVLRDTESGISIRRGQ